MKQLILVLALVAFSCNKKDDPKPVTPAPAPITSANTSFNIKSQGTTTSRVRIYKSDGTIERTIYNFDVNSSLPPSKDTTVNVNFIRREIKIDLTGTYPVTLTVNSGHKSYTFIDSTEKGQRTLNLW